MKPQTLVKCLIGIPRFPLMAAGTPVAGLNNGPAGDPLGPLSWLLGGRPPSSTRVSPPEVDPTEADATPSGEGGGGR